MKAIVIYESMFGNTHAVADAIGAGLREGACDVTVTPVQEITPGTVEDADLVVVGAPTHAHGLARPTTRKAAADMAGEKRTLRLDGSATGPGVREWLDTLGVLGVNSAAFDTRLRAPAVITGRASRSISKRLRDHGMKEVVAPESFFVTRQDRLEAGEDRRAQAWGATLARSVR